jgi:hypothetical protein
MADLSSILTDPNYVNANPATKQAIFDKFSANDTNFTGANPATQDAIRTKFGLISTPTGGIPVGRQGIDQFGIPITIKPAEPDAPRSLFHQAMGNIETIPAMAAGAVGGVVTPIAQLGYELTQGKAFTPQGKAEAAQFGQQVQSQFYQPRTPEAQRNLQAISNVVVPLAGLNMGGPINALAPAARAIGDVARSEGSLVSSAASNALAARSARTQAANVAGSYANAPIIDAAQAANRQGLAVNPAITNPTARNRARGMVVGSAFDDAAAKANAAQTTQLVRKDLGVAVDQPLNAGAVESALDKASKPYDAVRQIPNLAPDASVVSSIESLRVPRLLGDEGAAAKVNALIDASIEEISQGRSGALVIDDIRQLRKQAQNVYKARDKGNNPAAADVAAADARISIANALESLIDANVKDPKVLTDLKAARVKMAQIYDHERAINFANGTVDPQVYAKLLNERKGNMTGVGADIGKVASTFPEVMSTQTPSAQIMPRVTRSGILGALGALGGGAVAGYPGAIAGASMGGAAGFTGTRLAARGMTNPAYQTARAVPKDYRPAPNMLRPVEPNYGPNQMVPYDYSQSVVMLGETPNFVFGRPEAQVNVSTQYAPNQLPAPSATGTLGAVAAERARAAGMSRTLGTQAEAQQAAAEAAARQPTGRGSVLEFDPITGTYKVGGAGVKGATPEVFMRNTGESLNAAAEKVAAGKLFDMDAAEKVAWSKTKVDFAEAAPDLKGLSDKAIATKMMDRQWIADTISNLREKDRVFNEIAQKSALNRAASDAANQAALKREQMLQQLMELQDNLRPARPVQKGGQGPKTRAFQRNMLTPEQEILNALAK